jgi:antagonist of KipI
MNLFVSKAAALMTVQDGGRFGYQRFGLPESGPIDWWAFQAVNRLVGNTSSQACVEMGFTSAELVIEGAGLIAACGAGYELFINECKMPLWMAIWVKSGDKICLEKCPGGNWVYLGVSGGIQTPAWMGSRSFYLRAGIGKRIEVGDSLPRTDNDGQFRQLAGHTLDQSARPTYAQHPVLRVILGPHQARFTSESIKTLWSGVYSISPKSDRMGYRLQGTPLLHQQGADLVSQGMVLGEIQVPADGQPIVMMPDHPTTGGYACIGTVARVDLPLLAQAELGSAQIQFQPCTVSLAQSELLTALDALEKGLQTEEDTWQLL